MDFFHQQTVDLLHRVAQPKIENRAFLVGYGLVMLCKFIGVRDMSWLNTLLANFVPDNENQVKELSKNKTCRCLCRCLSYFRIIHILNGDRRL